MVVEKRMLPSILVVQTISKQFQASSEGERCECVFMSGLLKSQREGRHGTL